MVELGVNFGYHVSPRMKYGHSQMEYNWRDIQRKNFVNNVDMSRLRAPWQNGLYKNYHTERHKNTYNTLTQQTFRNNYIFVFFGFLFFIFFFI